MPQYIDIILCHAEAAAIKPCADTSALEGSGENATTFTDVQTATQSVLIRMTEFFQDIPETIALRNGLNYTVDYMQQFRALTCLLFLGGGSVLLSPASRASNEEKYAISAHQLVVSLAPTPTSSEGTLQRFHRDALGQWVADDSRPWPVMLGRAGLAWGRGLHDEEAGDKKVTGDRKSPMGLFKIGMALGYAPSLPPGSKGWPYHQVTDRDAWIDDPKLPNFNHLYTLPAGASKPDWWEKERMHLGDFAYTWLLVIEHNYNGDQDPQGGNAIFFHIRRGEHYRTSGCTTMKQEDLEKLLTWLEPHSNAMVAQLTLEEYKKVWKAWDLPAPHPDLN